MKLKTILSIWSYKHKILSDGILMKHKSKLYTHGVIQQWEVNYWLSYAPVVKWIGVRLLLYIASIHELPSRLIEFLIAFTQDGLDVDFFMEIPSITRVDVNRF